MKKIFLVTLVTFTQIAFAFPQPPWSKKLEARGTASGSRSEACRKAKTMAKEKTQNEAIPLKSVCLQNGGRLNTFSGGMGSCDYNDSTQTAVYAFTTGVECLKAD
jgi:hypothetical protein